MVSYCLTFLKDFSQNDTLLFNKMRKKWYYDKKERRYDMKRSIIIDNDFLRKTRKSLEVNQEYMASNLGVTRKTYARYEKERAYLDKETVSKIASLLSVDFESLVIIDINKELDRIAEYPDEVLKERLFKQE